MDIESFKELDIIISGEIVNTYKWRQFRKRVLDRDNDKCLHCDEIAKCIHHKKSRKDYPELCWDMENVISLCKKCHGIAESALFMKKN